MKNLLALLSVALLVAACGILPRKAAPAPEVPAAPEPAPARKEPAKPPPPPEPAPPKAPPPAKTAPEPPPPPPPEATADKAWTAGAAALEEGRPGRALDLFSEAWKEVPGHPGVAKSFPVALERLKKQGDEAEQLGKPEEAGKAWATSLAYLSHPAARGRTFSFTRSELQESLDRLTKTLMDKGLVEYRESRFESAISWWRKILAYDPANEEAMKSVRTATTQLENLKKISPGTTPSSR